MKTVFVFLITALAAYLLGCVNGAIIMSKAVFHEDVRKKGSGNAGLTNFYRNYGAKGILPVIAMDMLKMVLAVVFARILFEDKALGAFWAGFWAILGHCFPATYGFHGGKGILTAGALLIMLDWRIALLGFGLFFLASVLSGYISLGSLLASVSFPLTTAWVYGESQHFVYLLTLSILSAAVTVWSHRSNIRRLLHGEENKFHIHKQGE